MQNTLPETQRHRPLGVTIMAVLLGIEGILELVVGILALLAILALGRTIVVHGHVTTSRIVDVVGSVLAGFPIVIGLLTLIFSIGLWTLRRWAFWATVIIEVGSLLIHALQFTQHHIAAGTIVTGMIIPVIILLYFFIDPNVRRAFHTL
jgi:uncharacterized membrane protein (DUF2068 family)